MPAKWTTRVARMGMAILLGLGLMMPASAVMVTDLYESTVPAGGRSHVALRKATAEALLQVMRKVSGDRKLGGEQVKGALKNANDLLQAYAFNGGTRQDPLTLTAQFDPAGVDAALREAGVNVWGPNRPQSLLWIGVEDASGRRIASPETDGSLTAMASRVGSDWGTPVSVPLYDVADMSAIAVADLWGGFDDTLRKASARYRPDLIATVRLRQGAAGWSGDWQLSVPGRIERGAFDGETPEAVIKAGVEWLSGHVVRVYANETAPTVANAASDMTWVVERVEGMEAYGGLMTYLQRLVVLKHVRVVSVKGAQVTLSVQAANSSDTVLQTLRDDARLVELVTELEAPEAGSEALPDEAASLAFEWRG